MEIIIALIVGIALSTTSGFRLFVPFLILSAASLAGHVELAPGFAWIGTYPALLAFASATVLEIIAYFFPFVDNMLAAVSVPAAVIAGTILTASVFFELDPFAAWVVAIVAGGGSALAGKSTSAAVHTGSTAVTGGTANPLISAVETVWSFLMALLAVLLPVAAALFLIVSVIIVVKIYRKVKGRRTARAAGI